MSLCMTLPDEVCGDIDVALVRASYPGTNNLDILCIYSDEEEAGVLAHLSRDVGESWSRTEFALSGDFSYLVDALEEANIARRTGVAAYVGMQRCEIMRVGDAALARMDNVDALGMNGCIASSIAALDAYAAGRQRPLPAFSSSRPMPSAAYADVVDDVEMDIPF